MSCTSSIMSNDFYSRSLPQTNLAHYGGYIGHLGDEYLQLYILTHTIHIHIHHICIGGQDYTITSQSVTFAPSVNSQIVMVPIIDDNRHEFNENFTGVLTLPSGSSGVRLGVATATVTVTDIESENTAVNN